MTIAHLLEDFTHSLGSSLPALLSEDFLEDARLEAFEKGYQAGWDDASAAHANEQSHISTDLARNLQDLSFTYHEALTHVTSSLEPLLTQLVDTVLPVAAQQSLGVRIVSEVMDMAKDQAGAKLVLTLSPDSRSRLARLFQTELPLPTSFVEDASLAPGQIYLKLGQDERSVDLDGLIAEIQAVFSDFFTEHKRQTIDG